MALKHEVRDADLHFVVNADSRKIVKETTTKVYLMQYDHNSEEFTFDVPRYIENHDMFQCDLIQVHYENTSTGTSVSTRKTYRGVRNIDPATITFDEESNIISFGWLVPDNATMFAGSLKFQLKFICRDKDDSEIEGYRWHTDVNEDISIKAGLGYSDEDYSATTTATLQSIEINETEQGVEIILDGVHYTVYHGGYSETVFDTVELSENKTTTLDSTSTDKQYPSAKATYEFVTAVQSSMYTRVAAVESGLKEGESLIADIQTDLASKENSTNKTSTISSASTDTQYPSAKATYNFINNVESNLDARVATVESGLDTIENSVTAVQTDLASKENSANKTTMISASSTDTQYPSAKATYDFVTESQSDVDTQISVLQSGLNTTNSSVTAVQTELATKEAATNKTTTLDASSTDTQYPSAKATYDLVNTVQTSLSTTNSSVSAIQTELTAKEVAANKTTTLDGSSTDTQYPSAKATYDLFNSYAGGVNALLESVINGGTGS